MGGRERPSADSEAPWQNRSRRRPHRPELAAQGQEHRGHLANLQAIGEGERVPEGRDKVSQGGGDKAAEMKRPRAVQGLC